MYELIQVSDKSYYIQSPAKIGLVKLNERDISLIWWVFGRWTM